VRPAGQAVEHLLRVLRAGGLAVDAAAAQHLRVAAQHRTPVRLGEHRPRLADRVRHRILLGLLEPRRHDFKRNPELLEDLPPARRGRG
jgi:hypothetical protein